MGFESMYLVRDDNFRASLAVFNHGTALGLGDARRHKQAGYQHRKDLFHENAFSGGMVERAFMVSFRGTQRNILDPGKIKDIVILACY